MEGPDGVGAGLGMGLVWVGPGLYPGGMHGLAQGPDSYPSSGDQFLFVQDEQPGPEERQPQVTLGWLSTLRGGHCARAPCVPLSWGQRCLSIPVAGSWVSLKWPFTPSPYSLIDA